MLIQVLWSTDPPGSWESFDSRDWGTLPRKEAPPLDRRPIFDVTGDRVIGFTGTQVDIDDQPGWIHRLNIFGVSFDGDAMRVEHLDPEGVVRITSVHVDPLYEELWVQEWDFKPEWNIGEIVRVDGAVTQTDRCEGLYQKLTFYSNIKEAANHLGITTAGQVEVKKLAHWREKPMDALTDPDYRFGIWLLSDLDDQLQAATGGLSMSDWIGEPL